MPFRGKETNEKILSLLIGELREKDSNPRPPAYEAGELPLLHLAMCAAYTARCLRPETMRFKDFYRQPNNVPLLYIFFPLLHS